MRKFTVTFKNQPESITVEADDINMGNAGNIPCLVFFAVSALVPSGQGPQGRIIHIVPLDGVLHVTSEEFGGGLKLVQ